MKKWKVFLTVLFVLTLISLVASNIYWGITVDRLEQQLEQRQEILKETEVELGNIQTELKQWKDAAYYYKQMMFQRGDELRELAVKFTYSQAELYNTQHELEVVRVELETTQVEFETARLDLETYYYEKMVEEFQKGREVGYVEALEREVSRRDPTYDELWSILRELAPAINKGILEVREKNGTVSCSDWAMLVDDLAEGKGLRTGFVFLVYKYMNGGKWGHFLNSFETSDKGRVYMDYFFSSFDVKGVAIGNYYLGFEDSLIKQIMIAY